MPENDALSLTALLRDGPFAAALGAAMESSGLTLDRIRQRLELAGTPVSTATLSCWRSGRYQPSQTAALAALGSLERVLEVPSGALSALLGPPRSRKRWLGMAAGAPGLIEVWPEPRRRELDEAFCVVDTRWISSLRCLSRHARLELDAHGREHRIWLRQVVRAERDGPDRAILTHVPDTPGSVPRVEVRPPCRRGAAFENTATGMIVQELLFDRALRRGETAIFDVTLIHGEPRPLSREFIVHHQSPAGNCVMEVQFDPSALPVEVVSHGGTAGQGRQQHRRLTLSGGSAHVISTQAGPGRTGISWRWQLAAEDQHQHAE
ncbi:transcriptional regulator [Actinacidiphila sp. bgisy144]|uniref:transcriptional regulator n=1 Tax=unclassified Actinacidiphila TaxID=2995708 RepID=UPI003EBB0123